MPLKFLRGQWVKLGLVLGVTNKRIWIFTRESETSMKSMRSMIALKWLLYSILCIVTLYLYHNMYCWEFDEKSNDNSWLTGSRCNSECSWGQLQSSDRSHTADEFDPTNVHIFHPHNNDFVFDVYGMTALLSTLWLCMRYQMIWSTIPITLGWGSGVLSNYHQISYIRHTKSHNLNVSRLVMQLSLCSPLKPGVKLWMET